MIRKRRKMNLGLLFYGNQRQPHLFEGRPHEFGRWPGRCHQITLSVFLHCGPVFSGRRLPARSGRAIPTDASPAGWPFHPLPPAGKNRKCNVFTSYAIHSLIVGGSVNFVPGTVMTLVCASATNPNSPSDRIIEIVSLKTLFCLFVIILQIIHQTYDPFICYFH